LTWTMVGMTTGTTVGTGTGPWTMVGARTTGTTVGVAGDVVF